MIKKGLKRIPVFWGMLALIAACSETKETARTSEAERKALEERYDSLITAGNDAYSKRNYDTARKHYKEALTLKRKSWLVDQLTKEQKAHPVHRIERIRKLKYQSAYKDSLRILKEREKKAAERGEYRKARDLLRRRMEIQARLSKGSIKASHYNEDLRSYAWQTFSPLPDSVYRDLTYDNKVNLVQGLTYYIPLEWMHNKKTQHYGTDRTNLRRIKGDMGVINTLHKKAVADPEEVLKMDVRGWTDPGEYHTETSLRAELIDSSTVTKYNMQGEPMDTVVLDSIEGSDLPGLGLTQELLFNSKDPSLGVRTNYVKPLREKRSNGKVIGHGPMYAVPQQCEYGTCGQKDHPFDKGAVSWGIRVQSFISPPTDNERSTRKRNPSMGLQNTQFERITEGSYPHIGMELIRAAEQGKLDLYKSPDQQESFVPDLQRKDLKGMIVQQVIYYDKEKEQFGSFVPRVGFLRPEYEEFKVKGLDSAKDMGAVFKGYEPLFWYCPGGMGN